MWLATLVAVIGGAVIGVIVYSVPPRPATVVLFFFFLFLTVAALGVALHALYLHTRGRGDPWESLFHGVWMGVVVLLLALAQYLRILDWITLGVVLVLALMGEGVYAYVRRSREPEGKEGVKKQTLSAKAPGRVKKERKGRRASSR